MSGRVIYHNPQNRQFVQKDKSTGQFESRGVVKVSTEPTPPGFVILGQHPSAQAKASLNKVGPTP